MPKMFPIFKFVMKSGALKDWHKTTHADPHDGTVEWIAQQMVEVNEGDVEVFNEQGESIAVVCFKN